MPLATGKIFIPGFVRSPPTLAVYDVAHSLPLGGADRGFPFTEDEKAFLIPLSYSYFYFLYDCLSLPTIHHLLIPSLLLSSPTPSIHLNLLSSSASYSFRLTSQNPSGFSCPIHLNLETLVVIIRGLWIKSWTLFIYFFGKIDGS